MALALEMALGRGTGSGIGTGIGAGNGTRTTDSLFGDMLKLETQVGSTQELVPFSLAPVPELMPFQYQQQRPLEQFYTATYADKREWLRN